MRKALEYVFVGTGILANLFAAYKTLREIREDHRHEKRHREQEELHEEFNQRAAELRRRHR